MVSPRPPRPGGKPPHRPRGKPRPVAGAAPRAAKPDDRAESKTAERLQKVLAHAGIGSRRACEELILQGRVSVDGEVVRELGTRVDPRAAQIAVDGQKIHAERLVYFAVNKPRGYVSTNDDPAGRPRVVDLLPEVSQRVYTVGRLDEMSNGLMILTNDGALANRLAHPRFGVEKVYRAVVAGVPTREVLEQVTAGVWLAEGKVRARRVRAVARKGEATVLEMVLAEGKNREVRRMLAKLGHKVMSLTRVSVGPVRLRGLQPGQYRPLTSCEVDVLRKVADGQPVPTSRSGDRRPSRASRPTAGASQIRPAQRDQSSSSTGGPAPPRGRPPRSGGGKSPGPRPGARTRSQLRKPAESAPAQQRPPEVKLPPRRIIGLEQVSPAARRRPSRPLPPRRKMDVPRPGPRRKPRGPNRDDAGPESTIP